MAGTPLGVSWVDCVVAPDDADKDGLDDGCEEAVATGFQPELVFGVEETAPERIPFWAARPDGPETLRIFYALSYLKDAGDPTLGGVSGHDGDSEFIVLRVHYDGGGSWSLIEGYLSAHYGTFCDAGGWFPASDFTFADVAFGRPIVFSAEGKHANYTDLDRCDAGGCLQDHCSDTTHELFGMAPGRDLGLLSTQLIDQHDEAGNPEWFWTDVVFCGWTRPPGDARDGCVPVENSYSLELVTFEMDYGPVAPSAGLCEPCAIDDDCSDGGQCLGGVCGQACEGDCPTGAHCEGAGVGQCAADVGCACVLACEGRQCGDDGCGGTCGECAATESCDASGQCVPTSACAPSCEPGSCADDGCGAPCPCDSGTCVDGVCQASGDGGAGGTGGGAAGDDDEDAGCDCSATGGAAESSASAAFALLSALALAGTRRRLTR